MTAADTWINSKDGSLMRRIPAGEFIMGSTPEDVEKAIALDKDGPLFALNHETPQFRACNREFYLAVFAITNEQFARFLSETRPTEPELNHWVSALYRIQHAGSANIPFKVLPGFERHPVAHVSWYGAAAYCQWAGMRLFASSKGVRHAIALLLKKRPSLPG